MIAHFPLLHIQCILKKEKVGMVSIAILSMDGVYKNGHWEPEFLFCILLRHYRSSLDVVIIAK